MRKFLVLASTFAAALLAAPQADAMPELRKFGFGVTLPVPFGIEVPVNLTPTFRISPSVSILNSTTTTKPEGGDESSSGRRSIGLAVGAYSLMRTEGAFLMYVGGRAGVNLASESTKSGSAEVAISGMDIGLAGVLGSEYYFDPRFSLGAEISLDLLLGGDREADKNDDKSEVTSTTIKTGGAIIGRFYF